MKERRVYTRLTMDYCNKSIVISSDGKEVIDVIDVSPEGMKVLFPRSVRVGFKLSGPVEIHPKINPFYVKGRIIRVSRKNDLWEAAVKFEKVSTIPFAD